MPSKDNWCHHLAAHVQQRPLAHSPKSLAGRRLRRNRRQVQTLSPRLGPKCGWIRKLRYLPVGGSAAFFPWRKTVNTVLRKEGCTCPVFRVAFLSIASTAHPVRRLSFSPARFSISAPTAPKRASSNTTGLSPSGWLAVVGP